jgi:type VI protein secretion system component VasK
MTKIECAACRHGIDASAKLCPYCGADPRTGQRYVDTQALLQEVFHPRPVTASESLLEYARQRQGLVITLAVAAVVLLLAGLNSFLNHRNATETTDAAAVPLTDVVDVNTPQEQQPPAQMPQLQFRFDGRPQTMRTFIVEPGAVAPQTTTAQPAQAPQPAPPPPPHH